MDSSSNAPEPEQLEKEVATEDHLAKRSFVDKLVGKKRKFVKFKQHFQHLKGRIQQHPFNETEIQEIQESAAKIPRFHEEGSQDKKESTGAVVAEDAEQEIAELKQKIKQVEFEKLLCLAEKDLENTQQANYDSLKSVFNEVKGKFESALVIQRSDEGYFD